MTGVRIVRFGIAGRLLAVMAVVAVVFILLVIHHRHRASREVAELRAEASSQAAADLASLLALEAQPITGFCATFSWWDELCEAVGKGDEPWIAANIDPVCGLNDLQGIGVFTVTGALVHEAGAQSRLMRLVGDLAPDLVRARQGFSTIQVGDEAVDVAWATIHPTADTARQTAPKGLLVAARIWSAGRLKRLSELFSGSVSIGDRSRAVESDLGTIVVRHLLPGPSGASPVAMSASRQLGSLSSLTEYATQELWLSFGFGLAAFLSIGAAVVMLLGLPLRRLARALAQDDAATVEALAGRGDELGLVADAGLAALDQQRRLASEIASRRQAELASEDTRTRLAQELAERSASEQARKSAEMRTALALQGGNLCLWEYDAPTDAWRLDHEWLAYQGVLLDPTASETAGLYASMRPEDVENLRRLLTGVNLGEGTLEATFQLRRDEGGHIWILLRGTIAELDRDGRPIRLAGTMLDVTRWRELEQQLRHAQKLESIGQLAAGIAHEINTPIQFIGDNTRFAVDGFAAMQQLVADYKTIAATHPEDVPAVEAADGRADLSFLDAEIPKALEQTIEGVERVAGIVRAMKEFAHPGAGELLPTDLNHLVRNAATISCNTWKYVAELVFELDAGLGLVPLSVGDFNSVLLNLLVNAAHAIEDANAKGMRSGMGSIRIATRRDGDAAVLTVRDDGCGIPPDILGRIYDPFFTTKAVGRGSGQGLAIARSVVVDKHKGRIDCESTPGQGALFTIRLPLQQERPDAG